MAFSENGHPDTIHKAIIFEDVSLRFDELVVLDDVLEAGGIEH